MSKKTTAGQSIGMGIFFAFVLVLLLFIVAITLGGNAAANVLYLGIAAFVIYLVYQFIRSAVSAGVRDANKRQ